MTANHLLIYRLAELMLAEQQQQLPVDRLFNDEQIGEFVKSIQIDSSYQQMLLEGVLTETVKEDKLYVTFTVEGYFHFVLGEVIFNYAEGKAPEFLKDIIENNKLNGAQEGVEQCLIRDVEQDDLSRLMWLIDEGGSSLEVCSVPLANALLQLKGNPKTDEEVEQAQHTQIRHVMDELLTLHSDNDILTLEKVISKLINVQKFNSVRHLYRFFHSSQQVKSAMINSSLFFESLKFCEFEYGYNEISQYLKMLCDNIIEIPYLFIIIEFLENNSKYEEALSLLDSYNSDVKSESQYLFLKAQLNLRTNRVGECIQICTEKLKQNLGLKEKSSYSNLVSQAYIKLRDFTMAKIYALDAVNNSLEYDGNYGFDHSLFLNNLAAILYYSNDISGAIKYFLEVEKIRKSIISDQDQKVANIQINIGECYRKLKEFDLSYKYLNNALDLTRKNLSFHTKEASSIETNIGLLYQDQNDFSRAIYHHYRSVVHKNAFLNLNDVSFAESYFEIATCFQKLHFYEVAIVNYNYGLGILKHPHFVSRIVDCYLAQKKYKKVRYYLKRYIRDFNGTFNSSKYFNSLILNYLNLVNDDLIRRDNLTDLIIKELNDR